MEYIIEQIALFALLNGWQLAVIAVLGIVLLGILKYAKVFNKVVKENRKMLYLAVSVGASLLGAAVYLLIIGQFDISYLLAITTAIYALNQAMYSIYENTKLRDLLEKLLKILKEKFKKKDTHSK